MTRPHHDAILEFSTEDEHHAGEGGDGPDTAADAPDGIIFRGHLDALVAEADDRESSDVAIAQYERGRSSPSLFQPTGLRYAAAFVGAFALGALIAWSVLRSFDASPASVAGHEPASADQALSRPLAPVTPPAPAPARPALAATTETVSPRRNAAPATPAALVPTKPPSLATAPVTAAPRVEIVPKNISDSAALSLPGAAPASAIIAPPPIAAAASAAPNSMSAMALEQSAVLQRVNAYKQAYQSMDVVATAAVWPSVNRRALARAYSTLKSQGLELEDCTVAIADASATTQCRATVEYIRKIGNPTPRTGHQDFVFRMRKLGGDWFIDDVRASELDVAKR